MSSDSALKSAGLVEAGSLPAAAVSFTSSHGFLVIVPFRHGFIYRPSNNF